MSGAHHGKPARAPVQIARNKPSGIAPRPASGRITVSIPRMVSSGENSGPRVLAQQRLDGRREKRGAHSMPADVGHKIAEYVAIQLHHIVEISARSLQRFVEHREGSLRTVFRVHQNRLLRVAQLFHLRLVLRG